MPIDIEFPPTYKAGMYLNLPPRDPIFLTGSQFGQTILNIGANQQRDNLIANEIMKGNIPDFMRILSPITVGALTYYVSPDVLCVGNNEDFLRVPLNPLTATKIARLCNCTLPTKRICDQVWQNADLKLTPQPMGASPNMISTATFIQHNYLIEQQRAGRTFNILTGHKKDLVIGPNLINDHIHQGLYGWFEPNGYVIQGPTPNYSSHSNTYVDYAAGIRFINQTCSLNGEQWNLYDVLKDNTASSLISDEGAYDATSIYL